MAIRAGKLFQEVEIQQRGETIDKLGGSVAAWTNYTFTYAKITNPSGNDLIQAAQVKAFVNSVIKIRPDSGVRTNMRIVFKNRNYNIEFVNDVDERDDTMLLFCKREESVTNG